MKGHHPDFGQKIIYAAVTLAVATVGANLKHPEIGRKFQKLMTKA